MTTKFRIAALSLVLIAGASAVYAQTIDMSNARPIFIEEDEVREWQRRGFRVYSITLNKGGETTKHFFTVEISEGRIANQDDSVTQFEIQDLMSRFNQAEQLPSANKATLPLDGDRGGGRDDGRDRTKDDAGRTGDDR